MCDRLGVVMTAAWLLGALQCVHCTGRHHLAYCCQGFRVSRVF